MTYLKLYQVSQDEVNSDGYTFILIGYESADLQLKKVSDFDLDGNYGGPFDRVRDNDLRDLLLTGTNCAANGVSASSITGMKWWAYRTTAKMDSTAAGYEEALRINVKFIRLFADDGERGDFVIFSGTWGDIVANGIPEAGETACGGMIFSSFSGA